MRNDSLLLGKGPRQTIPPGLNDLDHVGETKIARLTRQYIRWIVMWGGLGFVALRLLVSILFKRRGNCAARTRVRCSKYARDRQGGSPDS